MAFTLSRSVFRPPTSTHCTRPCSSVSRPSKVVPSRDPGRAVSTQAISTQAAGAGPSAASCPILPTFSGQVSVRGKPDSGYDTVVGQYASLNYDDDRMKPYAIIQAAGDGDIMQALSWARKNKVAVAVRTGGHQYSGASSTHGCNIQLDVSTTYQDLNWLDSNTLEVGISRRLKLLNQLLGARNTFVPHGQCAHVHMGGHSHSGGYGLPGRAFGLFGDHIMAIRVITADGPNGECTPPRWIERDTTDEKDAELFWAVLGGSPGNFAVLTKIRLRVHHGADHPQSTRRQAFGLYSEETMRRLLQIKAAMAANPDLPADFDLCLTVMSGPGAVVDQDQKIVPLQTTEQSVLEKYVNDATSLDAFWAYLQTPDGREAVRRLREDLNHGGLLEAIKRFNKNKLQPDEHIKALRSFIKQLPTLKPGEQPPVLDDLATHALPFIVVFAEWANLEGADQPDEEARKWIQDIKDTGSWIWAPAGTSSLSEEFGPGTEPHGENAMPFMTSQWVFPIKREYDMPYEKRTYVTSATDLDKSGWVEFTLSQIKDILSWEKHGNGCRLACQIQHYGGNNSRYKTKGEDGKSSYSWRDTTVLLVMDAFYRHTETAKKLVMEWQEANDEGYKGPKGTFSPGQDRRVFWGSYEKYNTDEDNLGKYWHFYHEDEAKWTKLRTIKSRVDPDNVLSPNPFAVTPL